MSDPDPKTIVAVLARRFQVDEQTIARAIHFCHSDVRVYECLSFICVRHDDGSIGFYPPAAIVTVSEDQKHEVMAAYEWKLVTRSA